MLRLRRPSKTSFLLLVGWVAFCCWVLAGWFAVRGVEEPLYTVVRHANGYEVRSYGPLLAAAVSIEAPWSKAYDQGFALLSSYTEGDNISSDSLTAGRPVSITPDRLGRAASVPVFASQKGASWLISFVMPSDWTESALPRPNDPRVRVVHIPERTVAVMSFAGIAGSDRIATALDTLYELLARDKILILGPASVAQYQPSWAPPFIRRNEIMIPVRP